MVETSTFIPQNAFCVFWSICIFYGGHAIASINRDSKWLWLDIQDAPWDRQDEHNFHRSEHRFAQIVLFHRPTQQAGSKCSTLGYKSFSTCAFTLLRMCLILLCHERRKQNHVMKLGHCAWSEIHSMPQRERERDLRQQKGVTLFRRSSAWFFSLMIDDKFKNMGHVCSADVPP